MTRLPPVTDTAVLAHLAGLLAPELKRVEKEKRKKPTPALERRLPTGDKKHAQHSAADAAG